MQQLIVAKRDKRTYVKGKAKAKYYCKIRSKQKIKWREREE
jgi:hypothetical protein